MINTVRNEYLVSILVSAEIRVPIFASLSSNKTNSSSSLSINELTEVVSDPKTKGLSFLGAL
jgi:hypothetical protein